MAANMVILKKVQEFTINNYEKSYICMFPPCQETHLPLNFSNIFLGSLFYGAKGVEKEAKKLEDQLLDIVGPLSL